MTVKHHCLIQYVVRAGLRYGTSTPTIFVEERAHQAWNRALGRIIRGVVLSFRCRLPNFNRLESRGVRARDPLR